MKERMQYADALRCLAIFFVTVLHVINPFVGKASLVGTSSWTFCIAQNTLNRAGVPLFFMLSGMLILRSPRTRDIGAFYRHSLPRLAVPLLVWNVIFALGALLRGGTFSLSALFSAVINNGTAYHMWYMYTLLGIYLIAPFLARIVDSCTVRQLLVLLAIILFPTTIRPFLNTVLPVYIYLFEPLMEGYLGYFLLGYLLGTAEISPRVRFAICAGGVLGFLIGTLGNALSASPEGVPLPFNFGYSINHYLCAAALFTAARALFARYPLKAKGASRLAGLSSLVFGVYWLHVPVLEFLDGWLTAVNLSVMQLIAVETVGTLLLSLSLSWVMSKTPLVRKLVL